jgi:hypothetical protein
MSSAAPAEVTFGGFQISLSCIQRVPVGRLIAMLILLLLVLTGSRFTLVRESLSIHEG